ncbi:MAG TPA: CBS domain-containing protein [Gaiella sp.]|jgi:CBS domain-containing protein
MKEHEFWREKVGGHVYAVELADGLVTGTCGPLEAGDVDERFLATFDYAPDRGEWVERHRDLFDLYDTMPGTVAPQTTSAPLGGRRVSDVMHPGVMTCHSGSSLHDVARTMATHGVHSVAIWGDEGEDSIGFLGIVSALDLLSAVMRGESLASSALVAARRDVHTVRASAPLSEGARLMVDEKASHVIVFADDRDRIVGVLSALDVTRALTHL